MALGRTDLEAYITTVKHDTATWVTEHPFTGADNEPTAEPPGPCAAATRAGS